MGKWVSYGMSTWWLLYGHISRPLHRSHQRLAVSCRLFVLSVFSQFIWTVDGFKHRTIYYSIELDESQSPRETSHPPHSLVISHTASASGVRHHKMAVNTNQCQMTSDVMRAADVRRPSSLPQWPKSSVDYSTKEKVLWRRSNKTTGPLDPISSGMNAASHGRSICCFACQS